MEQSDTDTIRDDVMVRQNYPLTLCDDDDDDDDDGLGVPIGQDVISIKRS
jgi:hypothetical protein